MIEARVSEARVRLAGPEDAAVLGMIAPAAYAEAYSYLWTDADAYVRQLATFSQQAFANLLGRDDVRVWIANLEAAPVGFLMMRLGAPDPIHARPGGAEIVRVYNLALTRGKGVGRALFEAAVVEASRLGTSFLWLDAMACADWALRTYRSWGFVEIGTTRFEKGVREDLSGMVVMSKELR